MKWIEGQALIEGEDGITSAKPFLIS